MSNLNFLHSGGNKVTLSAPASNPSSDLTFKLPQSDGSAGQVLQTDGNGNLSWVTPGTATTNGITMADQWRISSFHSVPTQDSVISANWERVDGTAQGVYIPNGGMTQSSGVFSFPLTGIYLVRFQGYFEENTSTSKAAVEMRASANGGSSYSSIAYSPCSISNLGTYSYNNIQMETTIDVTNVSNVKLYWQTYSTTATALDGSSTQNRTYATFIRLGDT